jgi:8-oxo-dGTP pyrophosphatase MutT (NUDIX family)
MLPTHLVLPADFAPDPLPPPVAPKDAATVMLLRDGSSGLEVFLLRRAAQMAFAGGMTAYPGGGVDPRDTEVAACDAVSARGSRAGAGVPQDTAVAACDAPGAGVPQDTAARGSRAGAGVPQDTAGAASCWAGPRPQWWARRFGCDVSLAGALVCAAVRETFEESGVLLAGPDGTRVVEDASRYAGERAALEDTVARELSLAGFLAGSGLVLRADLLRPWANWVTPVGERRRYDTRFMLAELPAGQHADGRTSEAVEAAWCRPADVLADRSAGRRWLMPPTWYTLAELAELGSVGEALAASDGREIEKITPLLVRTGGELHLTFPGDPRYRS